MSQLLDFILHIDRHLLEFVQEYGTWIYGILFAIVFAETGLVVTPFLPGDSLLFAVGAIAGGGALDVRIAMLVLVLAALCGDNLNYQIGRLVGPRGALMASRQLQAAAHFDDVSTFFQV